MSHAVDWCRTEGEVELLALQTSQDFSPKQLNQVLGRVQTSWREGTTGQRDRLLELIRQLVKCDKDDVVSEKATNFSIDVGIIFSTYGTIFVSSYYCNLSLNFATYYRC